MNLPLPRSPPTHINRRGGESTVSAGRWGVPPQFGYKQKVELVSKTIFAGKTKEVCA